VRSVTVTVVCLQLFNCTDKCPDDLPHKATDTTSEQPETVCIAEPLVSELVVTVVLSSCLCHHRYLRRHHYHDHCMLFALPVDHVCHYVRGCPSRAMSVCL